MLIKTLASVWLFIFTYGLAQSQAAFDFPTRIIYPWTFQINGTLRVAITDRITIGNLSQYAGMARDRPKGYYDLPFYRNQSFVEYKTDKYYTGAQIDITRTKKNISGINGEVNFGNYSTIIYGGIHRSNTSLQTSIQGSLGFGIPTWDTKYKLIMLGLQAGIGKVIHTFDAPIIRFSATMAASKNFYTPNDLPEENKALFSNSIFRIDALGYISKTFYLGMFLQSNTFYYKFNINSQKFLIREVLPQYGIQLHINLGKKNEKWPSVPLWQNNGYLLPTF